MNTKKMEQGLGLISQATPSSAGPSIHESRESTPKPSRELEIDERKVLVFDDLFTEADLQTLYKFFSNLRDWHREFGDNDSRHWHLAADFPLEAIRAVDPFSTMEKLVRNSFPDEELVPYRAYCNLTKVGDQCNLHRDCHENSPDVTGLFYANSKWESNWGGETLFYDKNGDTVAAINPRPGRIILFRGAIPHRNGVPTPVAADSRYSVAYKFRLKSGQK